MTISAEQLKAIAAEWRTARRLYPIFLGAAQRFGLEIKPCEDLESPIDRSDAEVLAGIRQWLAHADEWIQVHQLRQFLQTSALSNEASLRALISRYLGKEVRTDTDRDKLDFLLVQYFSQCAPSIMLARDVHMHEVAQVLEPVLGRTSGESPGWLEPMEDALRRVRNCHSIRELLRQGILYEIRKLKKGADEMYFSPPALVAITRCNHILRQAFFHLMRADLEFIRHGVHALQAQGVKEVNCRQAQLSSKEPTAHLLEIALHWKKAFQAEYTAGHTFEQLGEIRSAVEAAMEQHGVPIPQPAAVVHAAPPPPTAAPAAPAFSMGASAPQSAHPHPPAFLYNAPAQSAPPSPARAPAPPAAARGQRAPVPTFPAQYPPTAAMPVLEDDLLGVETPSYSAPSRASVAPPVAQAPPATPAPVGVAGELQTILRHLSQYVTAQAKRSPNATATIVIGSARLVLSSWEVKAFMEELGEFSEPTQHAVAVRVLLFQTLESAKRGGPAQKLAQVLGRAHDEAARLQETIAESRDAREIEATVTLSATSQRLLEQMEEAEVFLKRR